MRSCMFQRLAHFIQDHDDAAVADTRRSDKAQHLTYDVHGCAAVGPFRPKYGIVEQVLHARNCGQQTKGMP